MVVVGRGQSSDLPTLASLSSDLPALGRLSSDLHTLDNLSGALPPAWHCGVCQVTFTHWIICHVPFFLHSTVEFVK